jgi:hypothetical protein
MVQTNNYWLSASYNLGSTKIKAIFPVRLYGITLLSWCLSLKKSKVLDAYQRHVINMLVYISSILKW